MTGGGPQSKYELSLQIEVCLKKNPAASSSEIRDFIFTGSKDSVDLQNVSPNNFLQFICYQKNKFKENRYCIQRVWSPQEGDWS